MTIDQDEYLPTRQSLLQRLKNLDDQASWKSFFDQYWKLIYSVARRAALSDAEAQDVVQETIICVTKKIQGFSYDPAYGSFKGWLKLP
jgi:DNA-directed RNA polymerase specialized sigma24 family protein